MANFLSPGIQVIQKRNGPVTLGGIPTAIGGFLLYTPKGPVGRAVLVTSPDDAAEIFGSRQAGLPGNSRLADSLKDFFNSGGGSCYVVRYIGSGSAVAGATLQTLGGATAGSEKSNAGTFPAALAPGDTFVGQIDAGANRTATINATPATKTGAAATYAAVVNGNHLDVIIAGIPGTQLIVFDGTEATQAAFLAQINAQLRGGRAINSGGQVQIKTDVQGSAASGSIVGTSTAAVLTSLGLTAGAFTNAGPNNVATVDAVTALELKAIFDAALTPPGSTTTVNGDGSVTWASNTTGPSSSVQFTSGSGVAKIAGFDLLLHPGTTTTPVNAITLTASAGPFPSPGTWANLYSRQVVRVNTVVTTVQATSAGSTPSVKLTSVARVSVGDQISITQGGDTQRGVIQSINGLQVTFKANITVPGGGYAGTENVTLETWNMTIYDGNGSIVFPSPFNGLRSDPLAADRYFVNVINAAARTPVNVTDLSPVVASGDVRPNTDSVPVLLTGGLDGSAPTASDVIAQVNSFNQASDINEISCPGAATDYSGLNGVSILKALENYGETRQDVMIIQDEPRGTPATGTGGARDWLQSTANLASSYEVVWWPWIKRQDDNNVLTLYPPSPWYQGVISRTHRTKNFGKSAAGTTDGKLSTAIDLEFNIGEQSAEYNDMYPANVNALLNFKGEGICFFGNRTLDPTGEFGAINVQIVFNVNKRLAKTKTRFVVFEPNDVTTRNAVVRVLTSTFREQRLAGILQGNKDSDAFFIQCDEKNNTALVISKNKMVVRVGLAVSQATEFLEFTFEIDTRAVDAALAAQATA